MPKPSNLVLGFFHAGEATARSLYYILLKVREGKARRTVKDLGKECFGSGLIGCRVSGFGGFGFGGGPVSSVYKIARAVELRLAKM